MCLKMAMLYTLYSFSLLNQQRKIRVYTFYVAAVAMFYWFKLKCINDIFYLRLFFFNIFMTHWFIVVSKYQDVSDVY